MGNARPQRRHTARRTSAATTGRRAEHQRAPVRANTRRVSGERPPVASRRRVGNARPPRPSTTTHRHPPRRQAAENGPKGRDTIEPPYASLRPPSAARAASQSRLHSVQAYAFLTAPDRSPLSNASNAATAPSRGARAGRDRRDDAQAATQQRHPARRTTAQARAFLCPTTFLALRAVSRMRTSCSMSPPFGVSSSVSRLHDYRPRAHGPRHDAAPAPRR